MKDGEIGDHNVRVSVGDLQNLDSSQINGSKHSKDGGATKI